MRHNREEEAPGDAMAIHAHSGSHADGDGDGFGIDDGRIGRDHRSCFVVDQVVSSASVTRGLGQVSSTRCQRRGAWQD